MRITEVLNCPICKKQFIGRTETKAHLIEEADKLSCEINSLNEDLEYFRIRIIQTTPYGGGSPIFKVRKEEPFVNLEIKENGNER